MAFFLTECCFVCLLFYFITYAYNDAELLVFLNSTICTVLPIIKGYCTSYPKLACFVLYLKIINTFLKNDICIL